MSRRHVPSRLLSAPLVLALFAGCPATDDDDSAAPDVDTIESTVRPSKRSEVYGIGDPSGDTLVMFGGNQGVVVSQIPSPDYLDQTWLFEVGYGWIDASSGSGPSPRGRYAAAYDPDGDRMLLFGGRWRETGTSGNYTVHDDLWQFDFADHSWTRLHDGSGTAPSPRWYGGGAYDVASGTFYVFGGSTNASPMTITKADDLWAWDGENWSEVPTSGQAPSSRTFFGTTYDSLRNRLVLFGGQVGDFQSYAFNDLFALDLGTGEWTRLYEGTGPFDAGPGPNTRMHAHLQYDAAEDRYVVFGGHTDIGDGNDLWAWDPVDGGWSEIYIADVFTGVGVGCESNPSEVPANYVEQDLSAPERRHRGVFTLLGDNFWIFGGMHAECSDHLDDTWRYDITEGAWHELIEARTGESCLRRNDDCDCLCL